MRSRAASRALAAWLAARRGGVRGAALVLPAGRMSCWQALPRLVRRQRHRGRRWCRRWRHGRPWLWVGAARRCWSPLARAALAAAGARRAVRCCSPAACSALAGVLVAGFAIGAKRLDLRRAEPAFGAAPGSQFGIGLGGALTLLALLMLFGVGLARLGAFRGDLFVACAVVLCAALLLLFVALPVAQGAGRRLPRRSRPARRWRRWLERIASERIWGLGCLAGGVRCGVAWNTLFLAAAHRGRHDGARHADGADGRARRRARCARPLQRAGAAADHHAAVRGRPRPDPAVRPRRHRQPGARVRPSASRRRAGSTACSASGWRRLFAFTPIAFMIMRGVVQGISPSLEEAAQTLRADRAHDLHHRDAAAAEAGPGQRLPGRLHREHGRLRQPDRRRRPVLGAVDRDLLRHRRRAVRPGPGRVAGAGCSPLFALAVFCAAAAACSAAHDYTTVSGKGDAGLPMRAARRRARACAARSPCRGWRSRWWSTCSPSSAASCRPGAATTRRRCSHFLTAFDLQWGSRGLVWAGTAWNSLFTTLKLAAIAAPITAALGLLIAWLLARTQFRGQRAVRVRRAAGVRDPRHGARRELHPGLQRAAVRADRHRR